VIGIGACKPPPLTENGVIGVFGELGLAWGSFSYPRGIAVEFSHASMSAASSLFVVDKSGRIQRFSSEGRYETGWRMPEIDQGKPIGLAVHPDGRLFVADTHYHRVVVFDRDGRRLGSFGSEGTGGGQFQLPTDVAFDADGCIYVSEYHQNDRVTKWSPDFQYLESLGDAPIAGARLSRPGGLVFDDDNTLWVADACNHRLIRFSPDGSVLAVVGEFGDAPGQLRYPYDIALAPDGTLVVCEFEGARLQWFSKEGRSLRTWGRPGRALGELFSPWGVARDPDGRVYVVDSLNNRVQVIRP
jgi:DNA-binding beta-propeller fold protein YncE